MDIKKHTQPENLERYSFLWSEVRLVVAAVALLIGGVPPVLYFGPMGMYGLLNSLLPLFWIISGAASVYMLYRWNNNGKLVFGGKKQYDLYAFYVSVVSGINLGLTGLLGQNIGMSISRSQGVFKVVALLYLVSAFHLYKRWRTSNERIF